MRDKTTKGFTLIELLIVLALISVIGGIASFGWSGYKNNVDLRTLAREISTDIALTKQKAIKTGHCYRIVISLSSADNEYTVQESDISDCSSATATWTDSFKKGPVSLGLSSGLNIESTSYGSNYIYFQIRGTTSPGKVVLENSKGSTATITTNITGKTYVTFNMQ